MMQLWLFYFVYFISEILCLHIRTREHIIFYYNNTYKYNIPYTVNVNKNSEYVLDFAGDTEAYDTPARITVASEQANSTFPVFVTARQQKGVFSWQLPMIVETPKSIEQFKSVSRTLCPHNNIFDEEEGTCDVSIGNTPIVHLSSSSPINISVTILVETVTDFYLQLNKNITVTSSPNQPKYYFYPFKQEPNSLIDVGTQTAKRKFLCNQELTDSDKYRLDLYLRNSQPVLKNPGVKNGLKTYHSFPSSKNVIMKIESDSDICAIISIQNFSCPVFDNERDILYDGFYLTMTRSGGITINEDTYPLGFYVVFIVKSSDEDCLQNPTASNITMPNFGSYLGWSKNIVIDAYSNDGRSKNFNLIIERTISPKEYIIGGGIALGFFLSFYIAFVIAILCRKRRKLIIITDSNSSGQDLQEGHLISPSFPHDNANVENIRQRSNIHSNTMYESIESTSQQNLINDVHEQSYTIPLDEAPAECSSSSDSESDFSTLGDINREKDVYRFPARLCVANLARKRARVLSSRSKMYFYNVVTVAIFYTLPVIQLVVTYQKMLNQSGNQDLCYYNFLCANPFMFLSDFNHVYSNLGYILLGILFLIQVWRRQVMHKKKKIEEKALGIPQHFGLLYSMGIALISEGILSAAYHVCPNSMNFQFDTSFMYVTGVLCMVKIYQSRHPDVNARAHATFFVLAFIIFIGLVGVLNANFVFWVIFTILHIVTCLTMTFQIYYMGRFRLDCGVVYRAVKELVRQPIAAITPTYCGRMILLFIANLTNWAIAAYGAYFHKRDFASHLLLVLMGNLFLYTLFYIVMKLLHRESLRWYSWMFIVLMYSTWFSSIYFFLQQNTSWAMSPAESRLNNHDCIVLMYDAHDIWHFISAVAMFFSFNMYLTIDDNLSMVPRNNIMVF